MGRQRNTAISVAKGIGIILMVLGHAEAPELVTNFIYTFHMPLFFITAGYFFRRSYLDDPWSFCRRRFSALYLPFVAWSIMFLLLHNLWHHFGILNESYGNWTGGVTHPYSWHDIANRLLLIVTSMSGYDEFMAGAFWFFRGLLVASILFIIFYKLLDSRFSLSPSRSLAVICIGAMAFNLFRIANGLRLPFIPNGGLREVWGLFFVALGALFAIHEQRITPRRLWPVALAGFALIFTAGCLHLSGMNNSGKLLDIVTLPLTGAIGFAMTLAISKMIDSRPESLLRRLLVYVGDNTMIIFILHIISFKAVSLLKIAYYGLDPAQIGCHMVIHYNHTDFFWPLYTIAGTVIPLLALEGFRAIKGRIASRAAGAEGRSEPPVTIV